ncbi:MAG: hypothetical protein AB1424_05665, partial [Thermodesulfobacteriota bacterium]
MSMVAAGQSGYMKRRDLKILLPVGIGAMALTLFFLLPGCGSESNTGGTAKVKPPKITKKSGNTKLPSGSSLVMELEKPDSAGMAKAKRDPKLMQAEAFPGAGITMEQLQAKIAADRAKNDPRKMEA